MSLLAFVPSLCDCSIGIHPAWCSSEQMNPLPLLLLVFLLLQHLLGYTCTKCQLVIERNAPGHIYECFVAVDTIWPICLLFGRCSVSSVLAIEGSSACYRPCPSPSASRLAGSPPAMKAPAASMVVVQQVLERVLLQDNEDFWAENQPDTTAMDQQDPARRNKLAMQLLLRLHILVSCHGMLFFLLRPSESCHAMCTLILAVCLQCW